MKDLWYFWVGLVFLLLAKSKHMMLGYTSPKPFSISDTQRCVDYDAGVVRGFLNHISGYTGEEAIPYLDGKSVLELGPGSDFGVGLELIAVGASSYHACDVNRLAENVPETFYDAVFAGLQSRAPLAGIELAREALTIRKRGGRGRLDYVVRTDFDLLSAFGPASIDVIVSNAAFEHFDDPAKVFSDASAVCKGGGIIVISVDMQTHSRWMRDADPNNIYRYPQWLYKLLSFRGAPNRWRPFQYVKALEQAGWRNIRQVAVTEIERRDRLASNYKSEVNQMSQMTTLFFAIKS